MFNKQSINVFRFKKEFSSSMKIKHQPVEIVPIDSIKPDPKNARKHSRENLNIIKESLRS